MPKRTRKAAKPVDTKPVDAKPEGAKPVEAKPAAPRRPRAGRAIVRINESIELELARIDELLASSKTGVRTHAEVDRRARTLASLARTLRELTSLRKEQEKPKQADDDGLPRDLGELRRALARRLEVLVAEAKAAHPDEDAGPQS